MVRSFNRKPPWCNLHRCVFFYGKYFDVLQIETPPNTHISSHGAYTFSVTGLQLTGTNWVQFLRRNFNIYLIWSFFFCDVCVWSFDKDTRDKGPHIGWLNCNMTHIQTLDSVNMADFTIGCLSAQSRCSDKKTFVFQFGEHCINFWTSAVTGDQILSLLQSSECNTYHKSEYLHQWMKKRLIFTHNYE